jgi:hypothetical protein
MDRPGTVSCVSLIHKTESCADNLKMHPSMVRLRRRHYSVLVDSNTYHIAVGLAIASGDQVRVKVLGCSSALEDGHFTGEVVVMKKVSLEASKTRRSLTKQ